MAEPPELTRSFKVRGRVQGVGFRWWALSEARRLGLRGTVRNCRDGSVEISFAGSSGAVQTMTGQLREGPAAARVVALDELEPPTDLPAGFSIEP